MLEKNRIYCGDCLDVMTHIKSSSVDLTVTSPPYDDMLHYNGYRFNPMDVIEELHRVTKDGGVVVWIVADKTENYSESGTSFKQALHFMNTGFKLLDTMIWEKQGFTSVGALKYRYCQVFDYMFIFSKGKPKSFNPLVDRKCRDAGTTRSIIGIRKADGSFKKKKGTTIPEYSQRFNVWRINTDTRRNKPKHPATFPLELVKDHICSWSNKGDLVLDPLAGAGTTLMAARELKRSFIGIEISNKYVDEAQSYYFIKRGIVRVQRRRIKSHSTKKQ